MCKIGCSQAETKSYADIFVPCDSGALSTVKIKVKQEMIQVERMVRWHMDNVENKTGIDQFHDCSITAL